MPYYMGRRCEKSLIVGDQTRNLSLRIDSNPVGVHSRVTSLVQPSLPSTKMEKCLSLSTRMCVWLVSWRFNPARIPKNG